jgi:hypothetical protein
MAGFLSKLAKLKNEPHDFTTIWQIRHGLRPFPIPLT